MGAIDKAEDDIFEGVGLIALLAIVLIGWLIWKLLHGMDLADWWSKIIAWLKDHLDSTALKGWKIVDAVKGESADFGTPGALDPNAPIPDGGDGPDRPGPLRPGPFDISTGSNEGVEG